MTNRPRALIEQLTAPWRREMRRCSVSAMALRVKMYRSAQWPEWRSYLEGGGAYVKLAGVTLARGRKSQSRRYHEINVAV